MKTHEQWMQENLEKWDEQVTSYPVCEIGPGKARPVPEDRTLPSSKKIYEVLDDLITALLPLCTDLQKQNIPGECSVSETRPTIQELAEELYQIVYPILRHVCASDNSCTVCESCALRARMVLEKFFAMASDIRGMLREDVRAAYEGDPAARSEMEVILAYPGFYAIAVHRIAHALRLLEVPLLPRIMSERAHSKTGIDIHPGATIGPGFFIDHGTGVVIGETCVIGNRVKIYQGVTLGALSFAKDADGSLVKGIKRHPDVEDNVIIYAGATILGGNTVIGKNSVIGGNVWLTHSVPENSKVYNAQPEPLVEDRLRKRSTAKN